jgi:hypothetical protein
MSYPYVHPLHVVNLARECHVGIILPSALYFLSLYPLEDLLRGDHAKLKSKHPSCPSSVMSDSIMKDYTLMFQRRIEIILEFVRRICGDRTISSHCTTSKECNRAFTRLTSRVARSWQTRTGPLHYMNQAVDDVMEDHNFCKACQKSFKRDVNHYRDKVWENLPVDVGLPSWAEMAKEDYDPNK